MEVCVCVCACVRACAFFGVRACACVRVRVCVCVFNASLWCVRVRARAYWHVFNISHINTDSSGIGTVWYMV